MNRETLGRQRFTCVSKDAYHNVAPRASLRLAVLQCRSNYSSETENSAARAHPKQRPEINTYWGWAPSSRPSFARLPAPAFRGITPLPQCPRIFPGAAAYSSRYLQRHRLCSKASFPVRPPALFRCLLLLPSSHQSLRSASQTWVSL